MNRRHVLGATAGLATGFLLGREHGLTRVRGQQTGYGSDGYGTSTYGGTDTSTSTPTATETWTQTPTVTGLPLEVDQFELVRNTDGEITGIRICDELSGSEVCHTYE